MRSPVPPFPRGGRTGRMAAAALLLVTVLLLAACERGADLVEPHYGSDTCAQCGKVIADPRFAAQYRVGDGAPQSFDDPACLFAKLAGESAPPQAIRFHAHSADSWLTPPDVWFARTPATEAHGSGWAAFESFAAAQDAVTSAGSGELLSYEEARARLRPAAGQ